jgi:hypothetical protein
MEGVALDPGSQHRDREHHVEDASYQEMSVLYLLYALEPRIDEPGGERGQHRGEEAHAAISRDRSEPATAARAARSFAKISRSIGDFILTTLPGNRAATNTADSTPKRSLSMTKKQVSPLPCHAFATPDCYGGLDGDNTCEHPLDRTSSPRGIVTRAAIENL